MSKRVYISADYSELSGDREVVDELHKWGDDALHKVDYVDTAKVVSGSVSSDPDCRPCDLKKEFNSQINVVYPEKQVAKWAAIRYTANHVFDYIEIDEQHAIFEVEVPESWVGKSVGELDIRKKFGINILGIKRSGKTDVSITPDTVLAKDITILALGEYKALQRCFRI